MNNAMLRDLVVLAARIAVGVVFVAHGWQKISTNGIDATAGAFDMMGVPAPTLSAWFAAIVELVGGALLIAGLALPVAALLLFVDMLGAFATVHMDSGVFVDKGGYELVLTLGMVSLLLAAIGAGRFSLDRLVAPKLAGGIGA